MKIRNTKMIGVIVSSFHIIFVPQVMNGIQKYASEHGYQILFYSSDFSFEKEKHCVSLLLDHKVDGIIPVSYTHLFSPMWACAIGLPNPERCIAD